MLFGKNTLSEDFHLSFVLKPPSDSLSTQEPKPFLVARSGMAKRLCLLAAGVAVGLFVFERLIGASLDGDSVLLLMLAAMGLVSWLLLSKHHYSVVAWLVVGTLLVMVVASAFTYGSVRTVNVALILVAQVAVGLLLSRRELVWLTVGAVALLAALTWADAAGLLLGEPSFEVGWRTWVSQAACLAGVTFMMYLNHTEMAAAQSLHLREAGARLQAQMERDRERERFARVFQSSPTPLFVQSARTGLILDVNPAFVRALGYLRKEVVKKRDSFLWQHDEDHEAFSRERRASRRTRWCAITAICKGGQTLRLQICSQRDDDPRDGLVITAMRPWVPEIDAIDTPEVAHAERLAERPRPGTGRDDD